MVKDTAIEIWSGNSTHNPDLTIVKSNKIIKLNSNGYTQSKSLSDDNGGGYWQTQADNLELTAKNPQVLILGFGGGTVASLLAERYPTIKIDGIDIDPVMYELGKKYLGLPEKKVNFVVADAFDYVKNTKEKYEAVIVDVFQGREVPDYIKEQEFYTSIKSILKHDGTVSINRIFEQHSFPLNLLTDDQQGRKNFVKLLKSVFGIVKVIEVPSHFLSRNYIFVGGI